VYLPTYFICVTVVGRAENELETPTFDFITSWKLEHQATSDT